MGQMQTELHTGMDLALTLARQNNLSDLLQAAAGLLQKTFALRRCWILELDMSGRFLQCGELGECGKFGCDDFSHPFAHSLQTGRPGPLSGQAICRPEHPGFEAMLAASNHPGSMWLDPLHADNGRLVGMLVLCRDEPNWPEIVSQPLYEGFRELLLHHWSHLLQSRDQVGQRQLLRRSLARLQDTEAERQQCERLAHTLIGVSAAMVQLRRQVVRAAGSRLSVLVQGETGCGKDLVARGIHELSDRARGPLIVVNCAAIPDSLLESELFGHTRGAFSGADRNREGLLAQADGGTLFLDEIGDMPLPLQSKLLRVLETRCFRPVGAREERSSDFRLVAATHQPLQTRIAEGHFRRDLYYRLSQFPVQIMPLRERPEDLEPLARHFIRLYRDREGAGPLGISSQALNRLARYSFPGNVRELRNMIELACLHTVPGDDIQATSLHIEGTADGPGAETAAGRNPAELSEVPPLDQIHDLKAASQAFEAAVIRARLKQHGGNRARAAQSLGMPKRTLAHKCLKYRVSVS